MDNRAELYGRVSEPLEFSHEIAGVRLYRAMLDIPRLSGVNDRIPLLVPERLIDGIRDSVGVIGQLRGYSRQEGGRRRLQLMVLVRELSGKTTDTDRANNRIELHAKLLRAPNYRTTPMGREIADLLLRVEREHGGEDCIPAIVWGGCARYVRSLEKGQKLHLIGRMQSRSYMKLTEKGEIQERTALELSINRMQLL